VADAFLKDWHIVIMRSQHQASSLITLVKDKGGVPILLPMQDILPLAISSQTLAKWINHIPQVDMIVVTSANAVYCAPASLIGAMKQVPCIVTMGKATSQALSEKGISAFFTAPPGSTSESVLMNTFLQKNAIENKKILLLAGEGGRTVFAEELANRGATVNWLKVYRQEQPRIDITPQLQQWQYFSKICFISTSSRSLENLLKLTPPEFHHWLKTKPLIVISSRITKQAIEWGFQHIVEAKAAHPEDILIVLQEMTNDYAKMRH
jgi:uroporphyrinogen-III synthase